MRRSALVLATAGVAALGVAWPVPREPVPTVPPPVRQVSVVSQQGLRVRLEIDRSVVLLGDRVNATVTLTNETTKPMRIVGEYGCDVSVNLRPGQPRGKPQAGVAAVFKERALRAAPLGFSFGSDEHPADFCDSTDSRSHRTLAPGKPLRLRLWWRARTPFGFGYDGAGEVDAHFSVVDPRQPLGLPLYPETDPVRTSLPLFVRGDGDGTLPPAAAVDAALTDPRFLAYLDAHPPSSWDTRLRVPASVRAGEWYVDAAGAVVQRDRVWWVVLADRPRAKDPTVYVDARTGAILGRRLPG